jgi:hypothetical protein
MAKRASIDVLKAGTVHNGKYLVLVGGQVADVEESLAAGREVGGAVLDFVFLPHVHPEVCGHDRQRARAAATDALGIVETRPWPPRSSRRTRE